MGTEYEGRLARGLIIACGLVALLFTAGCQTSLSQGETQTGQDSMAGLVTDYGGEVQDSSVKVYLQSVLNALRPNVEPATYVNADWTVRCVNSDKVLAFSTPGGSVAVSKGIILWLQDEGELAAVIGHEMAHVSKQHAWSNIGGRLIEKAIPGVNIQIQGVPDALSQEWKEEVQRATNRLRTPGQGLAYKFSHDNEFEADDLGCQFMAKARYNPVAFENMLTRLVTVDQGSPDDMTRTHPVPKERIDRIRALIDGHYGGTREKKDGFFPERYTPVKQRLAGRPTARGRSERFPDLPPGEWCMTCAIERAVGAAVVAMVVMP